MTINVDVAKGEKANLARMVRLAESSGERFVLADRNVVVMNLDDYEDMLFLADKKAQAEVSRELREYSKTGGIDYAGSRKRRLKK